ncbi:MAG: M24 family metallopeptidase [Kiritimatiellales bacterium]
MIPSKTDVRQIPPPLTTGSELQSKLRHLAQVLGNAGYESIVLSSEGALRWLTGMKHQLGDIAPSAASPVQMLVRICNGDTFNITLTAKPFEMPRLKDELPPVFDGLPNVTVDFQETVPPVTTGMLLPDAEDYPELTGRIIRPVPGGFEGNSFKKLEWLSRTSMRVLGKTARQLEEGMDGLAVRGLILHNLMKCGVDANLVLVALYGQESHLHPIASTQYHVERGRWMKLVVGARYAEHIVSQSLMVNLGGDISAREAEVYRALQQAAVEYADLYREGAGEADIHAEMIACFRQIEQDRGLHGFAQSATLHHPGGGTSPLGNRDRMLDPSGKRVCEPWTQFAINPVDALCDLKVELQGLIQPQGKPPLILDMHADAPDIPFRTVTSRGGTKAVLPDLFII